MSAVTHLYKRKVRYEEAKQTDEEHFATKCLHLSCRFYNMFYWWVEQFTAISQISEILLSTFAAACDSLEMCSS